MTTSNVGEDVEQRELSFVAGGKAKRDSYWERRFGSFFKKLDIVSPCDLVVTLLGI